MWSAATNVLYWGRFPVLMWNSIYVLSNCVLLLHCREMLCFLSKQTSNGHLGRTAFQNLWMAVQLAMGFNGKLGTGFMTQRMMERKISILTASISRVNSVMWASGMNSASKRLKRVEEGKALQSCI